MTKSVSDLMKERLMLFGGATIRGVATRNMDSSGKVKLPAEAGVSRKEKRKMERELTKMVKKGK